MIQVKETIEEILTIYLDDVERGEIKEIKKIGKEVEITTKEEKKKYQFKTEDVAEEVVDILKEIIESPKTVAVLDFLGNYKSRYYKQKLQEKLGYELSLISMLKETKEKTFFSEDEKEIMAVLYDGVPKEIWGLKSEDLKPYENLEEYCLKKGVEYWEIINIFNKITAKYLLPYENVADFMTIEDSKVYEAVNGYLIFKEKQKN